MSENAAGSVVVKACSAIMVMLTESGARRHVNRWGVVMVETATGARTSLSRPVRQEGIHLAMLRLKIEYFGPQVAATRSAIRT